MWTSQSAVTRVLSGYFHLKGAGARFSATPKRECSLGRRRPSVTGCIAVGPLLSDTVVSDTVSASSEKRSQSELSSSAVPWDGEKVDPSWVSLAAPTEPRGILIIYIIVCLMLQQSDHDVAEQQRPVGIVSAPQESYSRPRACECGHMHHALHAYAIIPHCKHALA